MTYPTLDDTWIFKVNEQYPSTGTAYTDHHQAKWAMKNALVATSGWTDASGVSTTQSNPWIVAQSSGYYDTGGGRTWVAGAVDYWDAKEAVLCETPGTDHAWVALTHPSWNQIVTEPPVGFTYMIDYNDRDYNPGIAQLLLCAHGYNNDGTTTNRPTPRDPGAGLGDGSEQTVYDNYFPHPDDDVFDLVVHTMCTTDGARWRQILCVGGQIRFIWGVDAIVNPQGSVEVAGQAWWPGSYSMFAFGHTGGEVNNDDLLTSRFYGNQRRRSGGWTNHPAVGMALWQHDNNMVDRITVANELTNEWAMDRIHLYCSTGGLRGYAGRMADLWVTPDAASLATGTTFNSGAFAVFGGIVVPWNTTVPVVS